MKKLKRKAKKVNKPQKPKLSTEVKLIKFTPKEHTFERADGTTFKISSLELNMKKLKVGQWYNFISEQKEILE